MSRRNRGNRDAGAGLCNTYLGGLGMGHLARDLEHETGVEPSPFRVWRVAHTPRTEPDGVQPPLPAPVHELADEYTQALREKHGEDANPEEMPVDPVVVYDHFDGRAHGRYGSFNAVVPPEGYRPDGRRRRRGARTADRAQEDAQNRRIAELEERNRQLEEENAWERRERDEDRRAREEERRERQVAMERLKAVQDQNLYMLRMYQQHGFQVAGTGSPSQPTVYTPTQGAPQVGATPPAFVPPANFPMAYFPPPPRTSLGASGSGTAAAAVVASQGDVDSASQAFVDNLFNPNPDCDFSGGGSPHVM